MLDTDIYMHDLAMLKLKNENITEMTNEQIFCEYMNTLAELKEAKKKYREKHPSDFGGTYLT